MSDTFHKFTVWVDAADYSVAGASDVLNSLKGVVEVDFEETQKA